MNNQTERQYSATEDVERAILKGKRSQGLSVEVFSQNKNYEEFYFHNHDFSKLGKP